jgi:hypothetical protein
VISAKPGDSVWMLVEHWRHQRYTEAVEHGRRVLAEGHHDPNAILLLAHAAIKIGDRVTLALALPCLERTTGSDPSAAASMLQLERKVIAVDAVDAFRRGETEVVLDLLEISRRVNPVFSEIWPAAPAHCVGSSPAPAIPAYRSKVPLLRLEMPASGVAKPGRRVLLLARRFVDGPESREHESPPRIRRALERSGWRCFLCDPSFATGARTPVTVERLMHLAHSVRPDLVLIDDFGFPVSTASLISFIERARAEYPHIRMIQIHYDPWIRELWDRMRVLAPSYDRIWCPMPSVDLWQTPGFKDKMIFAPFPMGIALDELPAAVRKRRVVFRGSVAIYNWSRAYWLTALERVHAAIDCLPSARAPDGLDAISSYWLYLSSLQTADTVLSFALRGDGSRTATGRSFETIYSGQLLLQEQNDDLDYYFVPGEHYFAFRTFYELRGLLAALQRDASLVEQVRTEGQRFYADTYGDAKIVAHLDHIVFGT